ncbi:DNA-directed primase/polymerase protein-like [Pecten maximus]|uniref:DNA-directed primase/polymerase protein-like n=1 Tax=Pecten maximus TaxID=6579 RepID=UPI001458D024|nr:DNA-directed primase/polymerase protein-like [Pecten maximus]
MSYLDVSGVSRFYGGKQKRQWSKLEAAVNERVKKHRSEKIPETFKQRISGPSVKWRTFFRQQDAFLYARSQAEDLHVFAFESELLGSESGQRQYLVTSYPVFWHFYSQLKKSCRHHYEVIPENAVCKLYFDLEFLKEHNPGRDGDGMVDIFIKYVCYWLKQKFGISCDRKAVLDLDASTEVKFSRHLLYLLPGVAFRDNIHAGNFVHFVANEVREHSERSGTRNQENEMPRHGYTGEMKDLPEGITTRDLESLMVKNKEGEEVLFCDLGVYTKNRNFRLYLSCKLGKDNPLLLSFKNLYCPTSPRPGSGDLHQSPRQGSGDIHQSPRPGSGDLHQSPRPGSGDLHQSPRPGSGDIHQSPRPGSGDIHQSPRPGSGDLHQSPRPGSGDLHQSPRPGSGDLHQSPRPGSGDLHQSPRPGSGDLHQSPRPGSGDLHQSPRLGSGDIHQSPRPGSECLHQSPKRGSECLHQSPRPGSGDLHQSRRPGSGDLHQSPRRGSEGLQWSPGLEEDKSNHHRLIFMDSLVANVQYQTDTRILSFDSDRIKCRSSCHRKDDRPETSSLYMWGIKTFIICTLETLDGQHHSPYPEVDDYITSCVQRNGTKGLIRHWTYFSEGEIIVYEIGKNRWCENIGRPHKSNNIMMIADLKKAVYYQKCHDPDCQMQNYKSPDYPLPKDVLLSSFFQESDDDFLDETDDQECLQAAIEMESSFNDVTALTGQEHLK